MIINDSDGLGWLNEADLSTVSYYQFDLEAEFDIKQYLVILSDEASVPGVVQYVTSIPVLTMVDKTVVPYKYSLFKWSKCA